MGYYVPCTGTAHRSRPPATTGINSPLLSLAPPILETMNAQECVDALTEKSKAGNEMVANLVQSLGSALVYPDAGNFDTNRKLWDNYAAEWEPNARCLLSRMFFELRCRHGTCGMRIGELLPTQTPLRKHAYHISVISNQLLKNSATRSGLCIGICRECAIRGDPNM